MIAYKHTNLVTYDLRNYSHGMPILIFWCIKRQIHTHNGRERLWMKYNSTLCDQSKSFQSINIKTNCFLVMLKVNTKVMYYIFKKNHTNKNAFEHTKLIR